MELKTTWTERNKKAKERMQICETCEHLERNLYVCKKCGCFLKGKTMFPNSSCPIGKWDKYFESNTEN